MNYLACSVCILSVLATGNELPVDTKLDFEKALKDMHDEISKIEKIPSMEKTSDKDFEGEFNLNDTTEVFYTSGSNGEKDGDAGVNETTGPLNRPHATREISMSGNINGSSFGRSVAGEIDPLPLVNNEDGNSQGTLSDHYERYKKTVSKIRKPYTSGNDGYDAQYYEERTKNSYSKVSIQYPAEKSGDLANPIDPLEYAYMRIGALPRKHRPSLASSCSSASSLYENIVTNDEALRDAAARLENIRKASRRERGRSPSVCSSISSRSKNSKHSRSSSRRSLHRGESLERPLLHSKASLTEGKPAELLDGNKKSALSISPEPRSAVYYSSPVLSKPSNEEAPVERVTSSLVNNKRSETTSPFDSSISTTKTNPLGSSDSNISRGSNKENSEGNVATSNPGETSAGAKPEEPSNETLSFIKFKVPEISIELTKNNDVNTTLSDHKEFEQAKLELFERISRDLQDFCDKVGGNVGTELKGQGFEPEKIGSEITGLSIQFTTRSGKKLSTSKSSLQEP